MTRMLTGAVFAAALAAAEPALDVTYVANAGFLIEGGGKKVLIDSLFDYPETYSPPSAAALEEMNKAGVDLILVTHAHRDHIAPKLAVSYLRQNAKAHLAAHTQVVELMRKEEGFAEVADRVHELRIDFGAWERQTVNGVTFDALCLTHGIQEDPTRNLVFLVNLGGMRFLHTGDAQLAYNAELLRAYPFDEARLNLLFDGYPYPGDKEMMGAVLRPEHLVVMHVAPEEREREEKRVHTLFSDAVIFSKSMERRTFHPAPDPALDVAYIGNTGFLVEGGGRKVLVDALFNDGFGTYLAPSAETLADLAKAGPDLILTTHRHRDHIDPKTAIAHLRQNIKGHLVAHSQVVELLRKEEGFSEVEQRVHEIQLEPGARERLMVNGVTLDALCLEHGPYFRDGRNVHAATRNLAFVVNLGGMRFLHIGDADLERSAAHLRAYPFREEKATVMFGTGPSASEGAQRLIGETIKPAHMVAMHLPPAELEAQTKAIQASYPNAIIFAKSMDKRLFRAGVDFHALSGPYLGQAPPEGTPLRFATGVVSTARLEHSAPAFSPDGSEAFWSSPPAGIMTMRRTDDGWTAPRVASFSAPHADGPVFSLDGRRLYFRSKRPRPGQTAMVEGPGDIWYVKKQGEIWSEPVCVCLTAQFPELKYAAGPSFTRSGTMYFESGTGLSVTRLVDGRYTQPERLPPSINMPDRLNWTSFAAPDESYLIFSSNRRAPKEDAGDLYITYRGADGAWTDPVALPEPVNTGRQERFPAVSPDEKYLFFTRPTPSGSQDVFWVKADVIPQKAR